MKLLASMQGLVGVRVSLEEVMPPPPTPPLVDIINGIASHFSFAVRPAPETFGMGVPLAFQGGKMEVDGQSVALQQMFVLPDGDIVSGLTTEEAEAGMSALIEYLNGQWRYRMPGPSSRMYYASNVVVDFDAPIAKRLGELGSLQGLLTKHLPSEEPFHFFRLAYTRGFNNLPNPQFTNLLDSLERADFVIERRAGHPLTANRFFCTAPCHTAEHVRVLQEFERALS